MTAIRTPGTLIKGEDFPSVGCVGVQLLRLYIKLRKTMQMLLSKIPNLNKITSKPTHREDLDFLGKWLISS